MKERNHSDRRRVFEIYGNKCANFEEPGIHHGKPTIHHIDFKSDKGNLFDNDHTIENKANYPSLCENCQKHLHETVVFMAEHDTHRHYSRKKRRRENRQSRRQALYA